MRKKLKNKIVFLLFLLGLVFLIGGVGYWILSYRFALVEEKAKKENVVKVYFFKSGKLFAVKREVGPDEAPLKRALTELLSGPTEREVAQGVISYLPPAVKLISFRVKNKTAVLNFNREIENYGGGSARLQGMIAQVVYTATEIPGIEKVWIWVEGQKDVILGGEGLVLDHPLSRGEVGY